MSDANQRDENGTPRVAKIEEHEDPPPPPGLPFAVVGLFGAHLLTILLLLLLMPFYIVLAVKNDWIDQRLALFGWC